MGQNKNPEGQDPNKLRQMTEAAEGKKPRDNAKSPKPQESNGLINNLEQATTEMAKKVGEGIMKLLNPMIWFATAMSLTRPVLAQVDQQLEDRYMEFANLFR